MGLVKTRRLAAMQKQQRAKAGMKGAKSFSPAKKIWYNIQHPGAKKRENDEVDRRDCRGRIVRP